ncbi:MAG: hypothetical protein CM1200mP18_03120 [Gammaproteobacteria bacterium]|nr:MAG: hypothetical protein CM1200mP18_03120 [Gammaproteobacteria bacterium]
MSMVLQEPYLFSGSIFENIQYSSTDRTQADIEAAAHAVGAHEFIARLPVAMSLLWTSGGNLSLGDVS